MGKLGDAHFASVDQQPSWLGDFSRHLLPQTSCSLCSSRLVSPIANDKLPHPLRLHHRLALDIASIPRRDLSLPHFTHLHVFIESIYRCPASLILYPPSRPTIPTAIWNPKPHGHAPSSAHVSHGQLRVRAHDDCYVLNLRPSAMTTLP